MKKIRRDSMKMGKERRMANIKRIAGGMCDTPWYKGPCLQSECDPIGWWECKWLKTK